MKKYIDILKNIGIEMKKYRVENRITQQGLSRILGVSNKTISCYERGKLTPHLKTVIKFLEVIND